MKLLPPLAALAAATLALPAIAQDQGGNARFAATTLDVSGHGEARVPPDKATIMLGVQTQGVTAAAAMQANAAQMTHVVGALRAGGVASRDVQTATLSVSPQYAYVQGQAPRLTGYQADNQVTVTVEDLARLGQVIDAVVGAGATNVGDISFGLKSRGSAENYARLAAVKDLDDRAQILADAAGYHIKRLVNLSEATSQQSPPRPVYAMAVRASAPAQTPVETGEILVTVDVTGEFELTH
jgi:uncharacterized protein YggE